MDWAHLLNEVPESRYVFSEGPYEDLIDRAAKMLSRADAVLIGAGAGLSAAAGLTYSGSRFTENFREFITKYGSSYMPDMYSAGFYPFPTEEERWGYWSKHVCVNRIEPDALPLYRKVRKLTEGLEHFVLTTNVDHQFWKAGFSDEHIFATQGDYGRIQCAAACHPKTYDALDLFRSMDRVREDCRIPAEMVPRCPVCGGPMAMHLRCDRYFVEDDHWHQAKERYERFLMKMNDKKVVLLELGVGFNTPVIIRFPFEKLTKEHENCSLIRMNLGEAMVPLVLKDRAVGISAELSAAVNDLAAAYKEESL